MPLAPATRLGRYEILAPLGAGGMGEVYRARDLRLGREVAVKVLPAELNGNPSLRARFEREARVVASVTHPNILAIHDVGTEGDITFAVTELLEGETLRARLNRVGTVPPATALAWALPVARGLAAAHEKGVVHRDLKPENVFLARDGRVTLLDFGLATPPPTSSGEESLSLATVPGTVLGTPGYMSPEQACGAAAEPPADVFAFGVLVYEMLAGVRPFQGRSSSETVTALLHQDPVPLSQAAPGVPPSMSSLVERCLAKRSDARYPSARELITALEAVLHGLGSHDDQPTQIIPPASPASPSGLAGLQRPSPPLSATRGPSIAVLPFRNLSGGTDSEYFSDGVTEEIIATLAKIPELHVAASTSSFAFRGRSEDVRQIGARLGVATILEGSVRQAGQRLRLTAQLVDVGSGYHLWSERYDRTLDDVFAVQDDIAGAIASTLKVKLLGAGPASRDVEAYDLYLRGRYYVGKRLLSAAIDPLERAVERDPGFVAARTSLADAVAIRGFYGGLDTREAYARALRLAREASALEPDSPDVVLTFGILEHYYGWDLAREETLLRRAVDLAPKAGAARAWLALCLGGMDRWEEAVEVGREAVRLEPYATNFRACLGWAFYYGGLYDEATAELRKSLEIDPQAFYSLWTLGVVCHGAGRPDESVRLFEEAAGSNEEPSQTLSLLGAAQAFAGREAEARATLARLQERARHEYVAPLHFAQIHTALGEADEAFRHLDDAASHRNAFIQVLTTRLRMWEPLWGDPRFEAYRTRLTPAEPPA